MEYILLTAFMLSNLFHSPQMPFDQITKSDTSSIIRVKEVKLDIVPPSSGIQIFRDGIIYLSTTKSSEKMVTDHVSFGKYQTNYTLLSDTIPGREELFSGTFGFPFPVESVTFSADYKTLYFTKFHQKEKIEKIFKAELIEIDKERFEWRAEGEPMSFCEGRFVYTHPSISADGKFMIFVSNRSGSKGRMDLFISRNEDNQWSMPESLGIIINSEADEMYPCLDMYGNLWFSSDRKPGSGGYDIYFSSRNNDMWEMPRNAGAGINTIDDDISFTISRDEGKTAFFSTRKKNEPIKLYKVSPVNPASTQSLTELITGKKPVLYLANQKEGQNKKEVASEIASNKVSATKSQPRLANADIKSVDVIYRVQMLANIKPKGSYKINIEGKEYLSFEYLHAGAYRTCVGEFKVFKEAVAFQKICRNVGYPQAFVVAFKNNIRSTDPALFK